MFTWLSKLFGLKAIPQIDPRDARHLLDDGKAILLDIRQASERRQLRIPVAEHLELAKLSMHFQTLPQDKVIIVQCNTGNRSLGAAKLLANKGLEVNNLRGGILAWREAGLETKSDS